MNGKGPGTCFLLLPNDEDMSSEDFREALTMDFSMHACCFLPADVVGCMHCISRHLERGCAQQAAAHVEELRARLFEHGMGKGSLRKAWAGLVACERSQVRKYLDKHAPALMGE